MEDRAMSQRRSWIRPFAIACLTVCCLSIACSASGQNVPDADGKGRMFGKAAPDFRIKGPYGEVYSLDRLKGNVILLQFGTSW